MRLTLLKDHAPEVYEDIVDITTQRAIQQGKTMPTCYIGHGGVSSDDMKQLNAESDCNQETLCSTCGDGCPNLHSIVEEKTEQARKRVKESNDNPSIEQTPLVDDFVASPDSHQIIEDAEDNTTEQHTERVTIDAF